MPHGGAHHRSAQLDADFAGVVADTMQALATPSRVRILGRLSAGACSVNELADAVGMEASAVSHQLRLLRHLGLVVGQRQGRRVVTTSTTTTSASCWSRRSRTSSICVPASHAHSLTTNWRGGNRVCSAHSRGPRAPPPPPPPP